MWTASILWMGLIAVESTSLLSADNTTSWLYPFFHFFTGVDAERFVVWDYYIRKTGHFVGYFGLSLLLFGAWRETLQFSPSRRWAVRWAGIAFCMTALVASLDEWHQTYLASRTGSIRDVYLDSFAALVAQGVILLFIKLRRRGLTTQN
jgi:VanZ family protein